MLSFVNAKINIGLNITGKQPNGYHTLDTIFYPIGKRNGTPDFPYPFNDIIEIIPSGNGKDTFSISGQIIDCDKEQNLIWKALKMFREQLGDHYDWKGFDIYLSKHIPFGAGLGGGSADAGFTLRMLNELNNNPFTEKELAETALRLGADCPFFLINRPCHATGIGETLEEIPVEISDQQILLVKPPVFISTKEAFSGITLRSSALDLKRAVMLPVEEWRNLIINNFEESIFPKYPILGEIKNRLYNLGAAYASMSGSGSTIYGIFSDREETEYARKKITATFEGLYTAIV